MSEVHAVQYGTSTIQYELSYSPRQRLAISVHPDTRVTVDAPDGTDLTRVEQLIRKRAAWILRQQRRFAEYPKPLPPREYVSGETHRYLGRQYRLKVIEQPDEGISLTRGRLFFYVRDKSDVARKERLLSRWYRQQAERIFTERLTLCYALVQRLNLPYPEIHLRIMKTRWGSCTGERIYLNPRLIQAPKDCIDYVIVHELCHLKENNHGPRFYALLDTFMPDWRSRREKLNRIEMS